jgi:hypothetical protein
VKIDDILDAGQMSDKNSVFFIALDAGDLTLVFHHVHGVIPACSGNLRASEED